MLSLLLLGRTGNNMFQYAYGRALAQKHDTGLLLDGTWFNAEGWAEVSHFLKLPIQAKVRRHPTIASRALRKLTGKHYWEYSKRPIIRENPKDHSFDPKLLEAPSDCVIMGYFQSPLYFESIADELRAELKPMFTASLTPDPVLVQKLKQPNSVAMHVRRTDFLDHAAYQVCDLSYYRNAIESMDALVPDAQYYIFSDDPDWCRETFTDGNHHIIDNRHLPLNPLLDMHLMSLASHHIIPNSSYSWWSAWLANKPNQQVILPNRWFAQDIHAPINEKKLPHWTLLDAARPSKGHKV